MAEPKHRKSLLPFDLFHSAFSNLVTSEAPKILNKESDPLRAHRTCGARNQVLHIGNMRHLRNRLSQLASHQNRNATRVRAGITASSFPATKSPPEAPRHACLWRRLRARRPQGNLFSGEIKLFRRSQLLVATSINEHVHTWKTVCELVLQQNVVISQTNSLWLLSLLAPDNMHRPHWEKRGKGNFNG